VRPSENSRDISSTKKWVLIRKKYMLLMNPSNMEPFQLRELLKTLKTFTWLRKYPQTLVRFYYQFEIPPEKQKSLPIFLAI
jgi:hypothetical protein